MFIRTLGSELSEHPSTEIRGPIDPSNSEGSVPIRLFVKVIYSFWNLLSFEIIVKHIILKEIGNFVLR